ncbi:hypothetical protein [Falsibacillus pallidus]|uniref:hypothetical protein n=1 Tax=Falsibacillus pallidus TaxID=493781 RepID=UPI003D961251
MKSLTYVLGAAVLTIFLASCNNQITGCPDAEIEWVDVLMVNDIKYQHHFPGPADQNKQITIEKGKEIGKVSYKMADNACTNHETKNGDAAYLEKGTPIYEIKGYPTTLAVAAEDKVYIADQNKKAKTAKEFLPLEGLVKNIYIESTDDGSISHSFAPNIKEEFIKTWGTLKHKDDHKLYEEGAYEGDMVFIRIELNNGVTFRQVYWKKSNVFSGGIVGNEDMKKLIENELSKTKN